ncbi:MAG: hypothetical protein L0177_01920, partial [Chloroflexi bacterium]|nr:hypothetical protein [Chloroflexota bacterium]
MARRIIAHLLLPLARLTLIAAGAALLLPEQGYLSQSAGVAFPRLVAPLLAFGILLFAADMAYWLGSGAGLRILLRLTGDPPHPTHIARFRRRIALKALRAALRGLAVTVLIYGLLAAAPEIGESIAARYQSGALDQLLPHLSTLAGMAHWAAGVAAFFALARAAGAALWI